MKNEKELYERAEELAENTLCKVKCLCPVWKAEGHCCDCDVLLGLREYFAIQLENKSMKLKDFKVGSKFIYKGYEFTKLADENKSCYCILNDTIFESEFGKTNDWAKSFIREKLNEFDESGNSTVLPGITRNDLAEVSLNYYCCGQPNGRATDRITCLSWEETWIYKFPKVSKNSWLRSGHYSYASYAYYLTASGGNDYTTVSSVAAVRPALHLKPDIEVEITE